MKATAAHRPFAITPSAEIGSPAAKSAGSRFARWEVKDMDEAVAWAMRSPNLMPGEMEIRPFLEAADLAEFLTPEELSTPREGERGKLGVPDTSGWSRLASPGALAENEL